MNEFQKNTGLTIAALAAGYFFLIRPITKAFNKSESEKANEAILAKIGQWFTPNAWRTGGMILKDAAAESLTRQINDAIGTFYDDEAAIVAAFKILKYKNQVSYLVYKYQQRYQRDLLTDLQKNLSPDEMAGILNFVQKLPTGK